MTSDVATPATVSGSGIRSQTSMIVAALLSLLVSLGFAAVAPKATAATPAGGLNVLSQSPWVETHGIFDLRLGVPSSGGYRLQVTVFDRLITRTAFDQAAQGRVGGFFYRQAVPLSGLAVDPSGGVDVELPVNTTAPIPALPTVYIGQTGVFPVQVELFDSAGTPVGTPQSIFLEYASGPGSGSAGYVPLSVALVVPFAAGTGTALPDAPPAPSEASRLNQLSIGVDGGSSMPIGLLADPRTLSGLATGAASGSTVDASTLSHLASAAKAGTLRVMPSTFDPSAISSLQKVGLAGELVAQSAAAKQVINSTLGVDPSSATWAFQGPVGASVLGVLAAQGSRNIIVPDSSLSPLPAIDTETTFARPTLVSAGGQSLNAIGADPGLAADFRSGGSPTITANRIIAELAMIETESPGLQRGVALLPQAGSAISPQLLATLIAGIAGNPLLDAVSPTGLFAKVPVAPLTRTFGSANPALGAQERTLGDSASSILAARRKLTGVTALLGGPSAKLNSLGAQLLLCESVSISPSSRTAILGSINSQLDKVAGELGLPPATAITLTASHGQIPITILVSGSIHARVQVRLTSQRLLFPTFRPADGSCVVPTPTEEICVFSLSKQNTTLNVPVEARSSGVFPLEVNLYTPDGSLLLASDRDTVRSTAVSGVAIILAILAAVSLAVWWGRDLRRGRRRRGLIPSPFDDASPDADEPMSPMSRVTGPTGGNYSTKVHTRRRQEV